MKNICFQLNRKLWVTMIALLVLALPGFAQKITVHGHVADEAGEDLIGASIMEKGTSNGTSADIEGNFTLTVAPNATLVVSYVGYDPMEVPVNGRTQINVVMKENSTMLAETVVIGYGSVKKSDATGSVAIVTPDDVDAGISTSAQDLLVGASPGVVVTTNGGDPTGNANIRIRGGSSLSASNDPLIVIDGVPQSNQSNGSGANALTMLNPQNIESMTILKDASATAIYGSRASNGVIIITTKKGKSGRPQVNFAANFHVNTARKTLKMMKTAEYVDLIEKYGNDRAKGFLYANPVNPELGTEEGSAFNLYDTDWQKEVLRTAFSHDYSLSVGGSAGWLPYRVNASYTDNQGIIKTSSMQRATVGFNLNPKFLQDHLSVQLNAQGSWIRTSNAAGVMGGAVGMAPVYPVYSNYDMASADMPMIYNGYYNILQTTGKPEENASENPLQLLMDQKTIGKTLNSTGNIAIDYSLHWLPELHFNLNLGYQVSKNDRNGEVNQNSIMAWRSNYKDGAGTKSSWYELQRNTNLSFFINYKKEFEAAKSNLDVTLGYDWQRFDYHGHSDNILNTLGYEFEYSGGSFAITPDPETASHVGHAYENAPMSRWGNINQLVSFFGRINYIFDDTYLLTFTLRDDGSSRFSKDNRWGLFPALALGWKINNMSFMQPASGWLNDFKLRLGWGETGQQDIGQNFGYLPIYTDSYQLGFQYLNPNGSGQWINPLFPQSFNPDLKWETTTTWNVGIDMGFLNNRITLAADWYLRKTRDLLSNVPTATSNTSNYQWRNIGNMENIGVEVTVGAKPVVTDDFTWNTSVNVSWNKNKITKLQGEGLNSAISAIGLPSGTGGNLGWHIVGQPAFTFMVYEQVYDSNGDPLENQYVDQNQDGVINDQDLIMYHSKDPKVTLTWNNNFSWKNWDLGFSLRANIGNYVYNNLKYSNSRVYNVSAAQYQLGNLLADTPLFLKASSAQLLPLSSYFVENASFLRCDNITLGYTFQDIFKGNGMLRIFAAVQNPFVITTFSGIDPEEFGGVQSDPYPRPITTSLGVVLTF
ncbi:MAG: TonB-dependent receptor [Muribaculaceae bacterium]|nr:TonB-dependent receptor [Muribaculaceae bacterium]MDE6409978.1 TonB-dependent receptor [Muribaculaceae bacterium]